MGSCIGNNKTKIQKRTKKQKFDSKIVKQKPVKPKIIESYGIVEQIESKRIGLNHAPLRYCEFLFQKFKKSDSTPQQVSLGYMLGRCEISVQKKEISLWVINSSMVKVWVVYGGIQKISQTGLSISIEHYSQMELLFVDKPSIDMDVGDKLPEIRLTQIPSHQILVILEPLLDCNQTMFMIYRYQIAPHQKEYSLITQTLQWNSLSFRISDIYGSEYLFKVNDQNQSCSVCMTNKSQCILLPCRHMCVCSTCLQEIQKIKPNCPLCRKQYYSVVKYTQTQESDSLVLT